jgi:predicted RNA-binding Zn-ribbon protein involved in translation (DUF1610 family)
VSKKKRPERTRTLRRNSERRQDKLSAARRKLVQLEPGGSPERPIEVASAAVVEPRAESFPCPDCGGALRSELHEVRSEGSHLLREVSLRCRVCGDPLTLYFRVAEPWLN